VRGDTLDLVNGAGAADRMCRRAVKSALESTEPDLRGQTRQPLALWTNGSRDAHSSGESRAS